MKTKAEALAEIKSLRLELDRFGVARAWLFGSRSRGEASAESDWDILVQFNEPPGFDAFMRLKLLLEDRLGGRVDLVSREACRPRFLQAIESELLDVA